MRNNKGYTLVELLVTLAVFAIIMGEIGNLIMNSSKLYRNGTYEVELQTEAQQIVQQMEELLIDVSHSVSVDSSLSYDLITISNNSKGTAGGGDSTVYFFTLEKNDPGDAYGTLYFNKTTSDVSGNVSHVPMAEYVQSVSLDMAGYSHDVVTLNVSMNNGRYGYQASQDIYLRNAVGSGGNSGSGGGTFDYDLDVLRFREYNLSQLYDTDDIQFTFAWDSESEAAASVVYRWCDSSQTKLTTSMITNGDTGAHQYYTLIATGNDPAQTVLKIRVGTKKVDFGTSGVGLMNVYRDVGAGAMPVISAVPVQGIDVTKADEVTMSLQYYTGPSSAIQEFGVYDENGSKQGTTVRYNGNGDPFAEVSLGGPLYWKTNEAVNTFDIYCNSFQANQCSGFTTTGDIPGYEAYMDQKDTPLYFTVTLKYNGYQDVTGTVYVYPYNSDMGSQESTFWNKVGWVLH